MKSYLVILMLLFTFSCKSTKKAINQNSRTEQEIISVTTDEISTDLGKVTKQTIITQSTTKRYEAVGDTKELKPITITTTTTEINEVEKKNTTNKKAIEEDSFELSTFDSLNLDKETEGMEVVEEIVGGITGAFVGDIAQFIIGAIFFVILLILIIKLFRTKKGS